jgi:hypothetical protein
MLRPVGEVARVDQQRQQRPRRGLVRAESLGEQLRGRLRLAGRSARLLQDTADLAHEQVVQADPMASVRQVPLELGDRQGGRQWPLVHRLGERGDLRRQRVEELVGAGDCHLDRLPVCDEPLSPRPEGANMGPVGAISAAGRSQQRVAERLVPLGRPAADDQPVLVEDLVEERVDGRRVAAELLGGVFEVGVEIVAVDLDDRAAAVGQRDRTSRGLLVGDHHWLHARLDQDDLQQPVKIGGHDHPHVPLGDELSDRPMRSGRGLDALLTLLGGRLEEPLKQVPPLRWGRGELGQQRRVVRLAAEPLGVPGQRILGSSASSSRATRLASATTTSQPVGTCAAREMPEPSSSANVPGAACTDEARVTAGSGARTMTDSMPPARGCGGIAASSGRGSLAEDPALKFLRPHVSPRAMAPGGQRRDQGEHGRSPWKGGGVSARSD